MTRTTANQLHKQWMKSPAYRRAYAALAEEFSIAAEAIQARSRLRISFRPKAALQPQPNRGTRRRK